MSTINQVNVKTISTAIGKAKIKHADVREFQFAVNPQTEQVAFAISTSKLQVIYNESGLAIVPTGFDIINDDLSTLNLVKTTFMELVGNNEAVAPTSAPQPTINTAPTPVQPGTVAEPQAQAPQAPQAVVSDVPTDGYRRPATKGKIHDKLEIADRKWRKYSKDEKEGIKNLIAQNQWVLGEDDPATLPANLYNVVKFDMAIGAVREETAITAPVQETVIAPTPAVAPIVADAPHVTNVDVNGGVAVSTVEPVSVDLSAIPGLQG